MASEVVMPKMGYDMTEGTILKWSKQPGDTVAKGEVLGEIETGKVNIEIEAFDGGILGKILVAEGQTVPVGTPIALITAPGEAVPESPTPAPADTPAEAPAPAPESTPAAAETAPAETSTATAATGTAPPASSAPIPAGPAPDATANGSAPDAVGVATEAPAADGAASRLRASPLARRLAAEHALDLGGVSGSGPGGRVVRDDVLAAVSARGAEPAAEPQPVEAAPPAIVPVAAEAARAPLSRMRQTIARRLTDSWAAAPHIFVTMAIDMTEALELRTAVNASLAKSGGKVSVNDLVVKAVGRALRLEPRMNASWDDGARISHPGVHVGVAVALDEGLITVVVPDADTVTLSAIAANISGMSERARAGKLQPEDLATASTFTVSNLGMYGVEQFTAILNPPEAGILAVGAAIPTPVAREGEVVVRPIMKVTLSADHRVVDGATAAQFLVALKEILETPLSMLI